MFLMIDNYDSFVYNLVRYFQELNEEVMVFRNDELDISSIADMNPQGIIISPGPKDPKSAGICVDVIREFGGKIPILGICLGHQVIAYSYGGNIIRGREPVHGKVSQVHHKNIGVFKNLKNPLNVTRYHSLIVERESLSEELEITSETMEGVIMGIKHKNFLIEGVQFHPEAELTECGHLLLENFLNESRAWWGNV